MHLAIESTQNFNDTGSVCNLSLDYTSGRTHPWSAEQTVYLLSRSYFALEKNIVRSAIG